MKSAMWRGVDIQASVFTAVTVVPLSYSISMVQYKITHRDMLCSLNDQTERIYTYTEERFEPDMFKYILAREDMFEGGYTRMCDRFQRVREITGAMYLYTAKMDENGEPIYVIDCLDPRAEDSRYPRDPTKREIYPDIERAIRGEIVMSRETKKTDWGKIFITHMPIYEGDEAIGVIGIELRADHQCRTYQNLRRAFPASILLFSLIAYPVSRFLFRCTSNPPYRNMPNVDYLTRLRNRSAYQLDMNSLEAKKVESGIGFILIDLNSLKHIDDTLGHDVEDRYIACISGAYLNMRTEERVMYRTGGDELVVMMSKATQAGIEDPAACPEKELDRLALRLEFTFSWDSVTFDEEAGDNLFSTRRRADKNMYMKEQKYYEGKKA